MTYHTTPLAKLLRRVAGIVPTREALEKNRWLRPFARGVLRADLWRFHRRSVPRAIALGFFLAVLIPFAHSFFAALLAVVFRANVPVAVAATWISNPFTWIVMWPLAYRLGQMLLGLDAMLGYHPFAVAAPDMIGRVSVVGGHHVVSAHLSEMGLTVACGLLAEAVLVSSIGYVIATLGWRLMVARRRRGRLARGLLARAARRAAA